MIEFRLGREGRHYRRSINCPTFYELNIQGPLQQVYQTFTNFCSRRIASVERGAINICQILGVDDRVIELAQEMTPADRLARLVADARAQARRRRIRNLINGVGAHAQAIFNSAAVTTTIAVAQGASVRSARAAQDGAAVAAAAGTQAVTYSITTAPVIAAAIAEQSSRVGEIMPSIVIAAGGGGQLVENIVGPAAVNIEAVGAENIAQIMVNPGGFVVAVINAADALPQLQIPSSGLNSIENMVKSNALAAVVALVPTEAIVEQFVGGGIRLRLNAPLGEATMTVSPVVLLQPTAYSPLQITTSLNAGLTMRDEAVQLVIHDQAPAIEEEEEEEEEEAVEMDSQNLGEGLGIYNKRKTKHRTKKYIRGRKGCKGTKKGCKGKKERRIGISNGTKKRGKGRGTSHKGMPPNDTMRIIQKLRNEINK
jgi:hypothetical protein